MILFILVFLVDLAVAFAWAKSIEAIDDRKAIRAGLWAGFVAASSAFSIISYNINNWLLIPAVLGSVVGTYLCVKYRKE